VKANNKNEIGDMVMTEKEENKIKGNSVGDSESSSEEDIKTFKSLISEVHEKNLCGGCGGCVSFCSAHELKAIEMGGDGKPIFTNEDNCLKCGICYVICPQIGIFDDELKEKYDWKPPLGDFQRIPVARATQNEIRNLATDGGSFPKELNLFRESL
jgi:NAD-dependent dihydropyrimidine dehydrogenase PreA subunit